MKAYWESGGTAPCILILGTRWRLMVSSTPRPLYVRKNPSTHWTEGWLVSHFHTKGRTQIEGVWEQGAERNIWVWEGGIGGKRVSHHRAVSTIRSQATAVTGSFPENVMSWRWKEIKSTGRIQVYTRGRRGLQPVAEKCVFRKSHWGKNG
jgi:hypothetical protein